MQKKQNRLVQKYLLQQKHKVAALEAKGLLCSNSQTCTLSQNGYGAFCSHLETHCVLLQTGFVVVLV